MCVIFAHECRNNLRYGTLHTRSVNRKAQHIYRKNKLICTEQLFAENISEVYSVYETDYAA